MSSRVFTPTRAFTLDRVDDDDRVRRIVVTGSESTGKTTLATQLAELLELPLVAEYSRAYAESVGRPLTAGDVEPIARGQRQAEDAVVAESLRTPSAGRGPRTIVLDTDLLSTTVYAEFYYGSCPPWIREEARARRGDLYLLCVPDLPWEADDVRDQPTARAAIHAAFVARLAEFDATVLEVRGAGPERLARALAGVRGWRAARAGRDHDRR